MKEFLELYKYARVILNVMREYEKNKSDSSLEIIDEYLLKEHKYLSTFSINSLNELYNIVVRESDYANYDIELGLNNSDEVLIYEHLKNALISSLFFANVLADSNFSMTKKEAYHIFKNPVIEGVFYSSIFLDKYMQACENDFLKSYKKDAYSEYYIFLPYYSSFKQILKSRDFKKDSKKKKEELPVYLRGLPTQNSYDISLDWTGKDVLFEELSDIILDSAKSLNDEKHHDINKLRFINYCKHLSRKHGFDLSFILRTCAFDNKEAMELFKKIDFDVTEKEQELSVDFNSYGDYYDYETTKLYTDLANELLDNSLKIFELLKMIRISNYISFADYAAQLKQKLQFEENCFKKLMPDEIPAFLDFIEYCYIYNYSCLDTYFGLIRHGKIPYDDLIQMSIDRIISRLIDYSEYASEPFDNKEEDDFMMSSFDGTDSAFMMQLYLYSIGDIDKKELQRRYKAFCSSNNIDNVELVQNKIKKMLFLNVLTELVHTNHLDVVNQSLCGKLSTVLIYSNGLENFLLDNRYNFNYHFSYDGLNINITYEDMDNESDYLVLFVEKIRAFDTDSELSSIFRDYCIDAATDLIDPKKLELLEEREKAKEENSDTLSDGPKKSLKKNKKENE